MILHKNERNIISLFITNVLASLFGFVSTIILARYLNQENLGNYYIISSIIFIITGIVQVGLRKSIILHTGKKDFELNKIISNVFSLIIIISFISFVISFGIINKTYSLGIFHPIIISILIYIPTRISVIYLQGLSIGIRKYKKLNILKIVSSFTLVIGLLYFLTAKNLQIAGAFYSQIFSAILSLLLGIYLLKDFLNIKISFNKKIILSLIKHGLLFGLAFLLMKLVFKVDLYIIKYLLDSKQAGIYGTGVAIVEKLWLFGGAAGIVTFAETANKSKDNINKNLLMSFGFTFFAGIILFFISDIFVKTFFGEKFIDSINVIKILLPGVIIFSIFKVLNGYFSGLGKIKIIIAIFFPVLVLNIILNFVLIPKYGINGAAISSSISYSLGVIILFICKIHIAKNKHDKIADFV